MRRWELPEVKLPQESCRVASVGLTATSRITRSLQLAVQKVLEREKEVGEIENAVSEQHASLPEKPNWGKAGLEGGGQGPTKGKILAWLIFRKCCDKMRKTGLHLF